MNLEKEYDKKERGKNMNTYSNIMTKSAGDMFDLCEREIERQNALKLTENRIGRSNCAKAIRKMEKLESILLSVPAETMFTVEGCRGDNERGWSLCNVGSIVECIVKYHMSAEKENISKTFGDGYDFKLGCIPCEVKTSLTCNALATPSEAEFTLLVNAVGVWLLKKADVLNYVNPRGRLPFNLAAGKRVDWLAERLGLDEE